MNSLAVRKYNIVKEMHTPGPTNCDTCDVTETDFDNINTHVKTHATKIQIQGELCNTVYKTSNNLGPLMEKGTHRTVSVSNVGWGKNQSNFVYVVSLVQENDEIFCMFTLINQLFNKKPTVKYIICAIRKTMGTNGMALNLAETYSTHPTFRGQTFSQPNHVGSPSNFQNVFHIIY